MMTLTINLTDDQARRLLDAAAFVGAETRVEDLVLGSAMSHLDDWEAPEEDVRRSLRDGIRVYAKEKVAVPFDLSISDVHVGVLQPRV